MARVRLDWHRAAGLEALVKSPEALAIVEEKAQAIAAACNAESSWGGYDSAARIDNDRARARVWSFDDRDDEARDNRILKNLDAGGS